MRDFINAPNGLSKQSRDVNERVETDHTLSPLGGRTVLHFLNGAWMKCFIGSSAICIIEFTPCRDVFDLPFHMARDQIEENLRNKMASIKVVCFPLINVHHVSAKR